MYTLNAPCSEARAPLRKKQEANARARKRAARAGHTVARAASAGHTAAEPLEEVADVPGTDAPAVPHAPQAMLQHLRMLVGMRFCMYV